MIPKRVKWTERRCENRAVLGAQARSRPTIHVFVVWGATRRTLRRVGRDMACRFVVLDVFEVEWTPQRFEQNLRRFYGRALPPDVRKDREVGVEPFVVAVVEDATPRFELRPRTGGERLVNTNAFDAKQRYREMTGGNFVHASNDRRETDHDLFFLFGTRIAQYETARQPWDGVVRTWRHDVTGADGWASLDELLAAIELSEQYVLTDEPDGGVKLLVSDPWALVVANLSPSGDPGRFEGRIGDAKTEIQVTVVGDGTADRRRQEAMLQNAVRSGEGRWIVARASR